MTPPETNVLAALENVILSRVLRPDDSKSYVASLVRGGPDKINAKILEEAAEVAEALRDADRDPSRAHLVHEAADLVFHLMVALASAGASWASVEAELARRFGVGGLVEKANRAKSRTDSEPGSDPR